MRTAEFNLNSGPKKIWTENVSVYFRMERLLLRFDLENEQSELKYTFKNCVTALNLLLLSKSSRVNITLSRKLEHFTFNFVHQICPRLRTPSQRLHDITIVTVENLAESTV